MKLIATLLTAAGMLFMSIESQAQLENTKWKGVFRIPAETDCYFHFKKDTAYFNLLDGDENIETLKYRLSKDTLQFRKLYGGSPCNDQEIGNYLWKINGDKLTLTLVDDGCEVRSSAIFQPELERIKESEAIKPE